MQIEWSAVAACILPNVGGIVGGLITRKNIPIWYKVREPRIEIKSIAV